MTRTPDGHPASRDASREPASPVPGPTLRQLPTPRLPARRRGRLLAGGASLTALALALGGCSAMSADTAVEPYTAADGYNRTVAISGGTLQLRNVLVVGTGKGKPGQVIGALLVEGVRPLSLQVGLPPTSAPSDPEQPAALDQATDLTVKARGVTQLGPDGVPVPLDALAAGPGSHVTLVVRSGASTLLSFEVPVFAPTGYYSGLSPSARPTSATPSPSGGTASPSPSPAD